MRAVLDRNLLSTILTCQAIAKEMMRQRKGRIVTIGSVAAFKGRTNGSIYAVAKAGMTHYTRSSPITLIAQMSDLLAPISKSTTRPLSTCTHGSVRGISLA